MNNCRPRRVVVAAHAHRISINKIMFSVCTSGKTKTRSSLSPPPLPKVASKKHSPCHTHAHGGGPGDNNDINTGDDDRAAAAEAARRSAVLTTRFAHSSLQQCSSVGGPAAQAFSYCRRQGSVLTGAHIAQNAPPPRRCNRRHDHGQWRTSCRERTPHPAAF